MGIEPTDLFRDGANLSVLDDALCEAINQARAARSGEPSTLRLGTTNDWACPRALETAFVLAPSRTSGRIGGLEFLINPYVVGPYAEGPYRIVVAQSAFRDLLDTAYADDFLGEPVRTGDVTEREDGPA